MMGLWDSHHATATVAHNYIGAGSWDSALINEEGSKNPDSGDSVRGCKAELFRRGSVRGVYIALF